MFEAFQLLCLLLTVSTLGHGQLLLDLKKCTCVYVYVVYVNIMCVVVNVHTCAYECIFFI